MARRTKPHKTGDLGESKVRCLFQEAGFAVSDMTRDYGEDLFVFGEDNEIIEPFKIYVQVKASDTEDNYNSDWTIYEDYLTVRNWTLGNDLTVLIRHNIKDKIYKYCIPEDEIEYWELPFEKGGNVAINCDKTFDIDVVRKLMWIARIRHYDRIVKLTQPNIMGENAWNDIPRYRLFCFELLTRLRFMDADSQHLDDRIYLKLINASKTLITDYENSDDMNTVDKAIYSACVITVLAQLQEVSGFEIGMEGYLLDSCACLLVQLMRHRETIV